MLRVRELAELARRLDAVGFEKQMGPFALVQRPDDQQRAPTLPAQRTTDLSRLRVRPPSVDFGDLIVATLPPVLGDASQDLIIGRSPDCDLVLDEASVSAQHATVTWNGTAGLLKDLGSRNGTLVNGKKQLTAVLNDGDGLDFGKAHFLYLLAASLHRRMRTLAR